MIAKSDMQRFVFDLAEVLDAEWPTWWTSVDPDSLDLTDPDKDLIAQIFRGNSNQHRSKVMSTVIGYLGDNLHDAFDDNRFLPMWKEALSIREHEEASKGR